MHRDRKEARKRRHPRLFLIAAVLILTTGRAWAAEPSVLVEDVVGTPQGVQAMDYLAAGKLIRLGAAEGLVLDYLHSCTRETITGGSVTIGDKQSTVTGGKLRSENVQCDDGGLKLNTEQAAASGTVVFRKPPTAALPPVQRKLYGTSPLLDVKGGGHLVIDRLDKTGERIEIDVATENLEHGAFYDFAREGRALAAGATYRATLGDRNVVFMIDARAKPGKTPIAGRLIRL